MALTRLPLIVSSNADAASSVMLSALLGRGGWNSMEDFVGVAATNPVSEPSSPSPVRFTSWFHSSGRAYMVKLEEGMLKADDIDQVFERLHGLPSGTVSDIIFISKHAAASGKPALTVHPIGNPNGSQEAMFGGRKGHMPAPSPRLAPALRALEECAGHSGLDKEFEVCFEATHHGPFVERSACMFVEIGSCENQWGRQDAAEVWASTLDILLGLTGAPRPDMDPWNSSHADTAVEVVVGFGGGHYAPKMGDYARKSGTLVGHMIATYGFDFDDEERLRETIRGAVEQTARAYRREVEGSWTVNVTALVDKKAFKGPQREKVLGCLDSLGVKYCFKKEELPLPVKARGGDQLRTAAECVDSLVA